jgi:two-component system LytT family response regulator
MTNSLTYILADDDPVYRELTLQYLQLIPNLHCLAACESAIEVSAHLQQSFPDLLLLDVEMPGLSGMQLVKSLKKLPLIIFITSHTHYAADAFEVDAIDYLVKPVMPERLIKAVEKARLMIEMKNAFKTQEGFKPSAGDLSFFIKDKNSFVKINYSDVVYIQSLGDFVNIFLQNGDKKIALISMKSLEQQLPATHFLRISRTHMVNKEKITAIETTTLLLNKIQLVIGKTYTDTVLQAVIGNSAVKRFI